MKFPFIHAKHHREVGCEHRFSTRCEDVLNECHLMKKKALIKHLVRESQGRDPHCTCWHFNQHLLEHLCYKLVNSVRKRSLASVHIH